VFQSHQSIVTIDAVELFKYIVGCNQVALFTSTIILVLPSLVSLIAPIFVSAVIFVSGLFHSTKVRPAKTGGVGAVAVPPLTIVSVFNNVPS
jgi:hypothetical protein